MHHASCILCLLHYAWWIVPDLPCMMHLALCTMHHASCIMHDASCFLNDLSCIMHDVYCIMPDASCIMHDAPCIMHDASFNSHDRSCIMHDASCIIHDASCFIHDALFISALLLHMMHALCMSYDAGYMIHQWWYSHFDYMMHHTWCILQYALGSKISIGNFKNPVVTNM